MPEYSDIPIMIEAEEARQRLEGDQPPSGGERSLAEALEIFHRLRRAGAVFSVLPPEKTPPRRALADGGAVAVAATLGPALEAECSRPWMEACCRAGLFQLEAYLNYRVRKWVAPKKLYPAHPALPGGALAPKLTLAQVLSLLPDNGLGLNIEAGELEPKWSVAYLYPLTADLAASAVNPCAGCQKKCSLRR